MAYGRAQTMAVRGMISVLTQIHPQLRWRAFSSRYIVTPVAVAIALALFALTAILIPGNFSDLDSEQRIAFVIAMATSAAVAVGVCVAARHAWNDFYWCERMTSLLQLEPIAVEITSLESFGEGAPCIHLRPVDASRSEPTSMIGFPPRFNVARLVGTTARAHVDPESPHEVVLETESGLIWPFRRD